MPQFIEFKITNLKFFKMTDRQRTEALEKIRLEAEAVDKSGQYQYRRSWNPFPVWLQELIRNAAAKNQSKARYDDENSVFRFRIAGDRYEYEQFYDQFELELNLALNTDPEKLKWSFDNKIHVTASPDDELASMNDLEMYQRNSAALPQSRTPQVGA